MDRQIFHWSFDIRSTDRPLDNNSIGVIYYRSHPWHFCQKSHRGPYSNRQPNSWFRHFHWPHMHHGQCLPSCLLHAFYHPSTLIGHAVQLNHRLPNDPSAAVHLSTDGSQENYASLIHRNGHDHLLFQRMDPQYCLSYWCHRNNHRTTICHRLWIVDHRAVSHRVSDRHLLAACPGVLFANVTQGPISPWIWPHNADISYWLFAYSDGIGLCVREHGSFDTKPFFYFFFYFIRFWNVMLLLYWLFFGNFEWSISSVGKQRNTREKKLQWGLWFCFRIIL